VDKLAMGILGVVSIAGLILLICSGVHSPNGNLVEDYGEIYTIDGNIYKSASRQFPQIEYIPLGVTLPSEYPTAEWLIPETVNLQVNNIPVYQFDYTTSIPLKKDRIHVFSGNAGPYEEDPRQYLVGRLCAYAYQVSGAPLNCERVLLGYDDSRITFARGYAEDEFIAHQAAGTNFAAVFVISAPAYGILGESPTAYLRYTD